MTPEPRPAISTVLDDLATIGPFFTAEVHDPAVRAKRPWRPMSELVRDPASLTSRIEGVRAALAQSAARPPDTVERRVAASVAHLGLVARLVSPVLGAAVTADTVPEPTLAAVWWQPVLGGPFPLSLPASTSHTPQGTHALVHGPIRELTEAVAAGVSVSPRVLWGNVASAINGACTAIGTQRPTLGERAAVLAGGLLGEPPLAGTTERAGTGFRRRSCCLIYRLAPAGAAPVCGDCVLGR